MHAPTLLAICLVLGLGACAPTPVERLAESPGVSDAPYPALLPLERLLEGPAPRATPALRDTTLSRVAALRARADALRGPVIEAPLRNRMRRGVRQPR